MEPVEDFVDRARLLLPNFPDEVLGDWLHRHWHDAVSDYGWLGFEGLNFERQEWKASDLLSKVESFMGEDLDRIRHWIPFYTDSNYAEGDWLIARMKAAKTWPGSILVLDNNQCLSLPNGLGLGAPYHLVEGHHRLGFLHAMVETGEVSLGSKHGVWLLEANEDFVSDEWPNI